jgi:DNA/RNA-binding domain of Phe-tRNA-synthetase-like protein
MKFIIHEDIFNRFPALKIGIVQGRGLTIAQRPAELDAIIASHLRHLQERVGSEELSALTNIKSWRESYRQAGVNPKKHRPTAEAFLRRVLKGHPLPRINAAVDAYLAVELRYLLPIGGYDLAHVERDILLRTSPGNESFQPLGSTETEYTRPGEIVYADDEKVLTRYWNYRDCDLAKITTDSSEILLACEAALEDIDPNDLAGTLAEIVRCESLACRGEYQTWRLDRQTSWVELHQAKQETPAGEDRGLQ